MRRATRSTPAIEESPAGAPGEPRTLGTTEGTLVVSTVPDFLRQVVVKRKKTSTAAVSVIPLLSQRCSHSLMHAVVFRGRALTSGKYRLI